MLLLICLCNSPSIWLLLYSLWKYLCHLPKLISLAGSTLFLSGSVMDLIICHFCLISSCPKLAILLSFSSLNFVFFNLIMFLYCFFVWKYVFLMSISCGLLEAAFLVFIILFFLNSIQNQSTLFLFFRIFFGVLVSFEQLNCHEATL